MEIERKWLTDGWPQGLEEQRRILMRQGYITTRLPCASAARRAET